MSYLLTITILSAVVGQSSTISSGRLSSHDPPIRTAPRPVMRIDDPPQIFVDPGPATPIADEPASPGLTLGDETSPSDPRHPDPHQPNAIHDDQVIPAADWRMSGSQPMRLPAATDSMKLAPPEKPDAGKSDASPGKALFTVLSSLAIVLGLFFVLVWFTRRALPKGTAMVPTEVVEPLGRVPLNGKQQMQLLRVGNKLVLLAVTQNGVEPLAEVTDPDEVERLVAICQQNQPGSVTSTFRHVLSQLGNEPTRPGFLDADDDELSGRSLRVEA